MPATSRSRWFLTVLFVVLVALALLILIPEGRGRAATGTPTIDVSEITLDPPITGSSIFVHVTPAAIGSADTSTELRVRNYSTGGAWSTIKYYNPNSTVTLKTGGAGGDLIQIEATNPGGQGGTATADVGYAPYPTDDAPPDFGSGITASFSNGKFTVDGATGALLDNSFPVALTLYEETTPGTVDTDSVNGNGTSSTEAFEVELTSIDEGDRMVLVATDDYGNRAELHFLADISTTSAGTNFYPSGYESATQSDGERTGVSGMVSLGDGNSFVTARGGEFIHRQAVYGINGPILDLPIVLSYRSGISYNGSVGQAWDTSLDERLEVDQGSGDAYWYRGDGQRLGPFDYDSGSGTHDSPPGVFLELATHATLPERYLTAADGSRHVFDTTSGLLVRVEDYYGASDSSRDLNIFELVRNDDDRVVRIDHAGRTVHLGWFDHGRLASIEDWGGRRILLNYDEDGRLDTHTLANGEVYEFSYSGTTTLLTEAEFEGRNFVTNTYDGSDRLATHRTRDNQTGTAISFTYYDDPGGAGEDYDVLKVSDALGVVHAYGFADTQPHELVWSETWSSLDLRTGEPDAWRTNSVIDDDRLLVAERSYEQIDDHNTGTFVPQTSTPDLETETWEYSETLETDPCARNRVLTHTLEGGTSTDLDETWTYGAGGDQYWPSQHTSFEGRVTLFEWTDAGQLEKRTIEDVDLAVQAVTYDIVKEYGYTSIGQPEEEWDPNRTSGTDEPLRKHTYHTSGPQRGYREKTEILLKGGTVKKTTSWTYDTFGGRETETSPLGGVTTWTYNEVDQVESVTGPEVTLTHPDANSAEVQSVTEYDYVDGFVSEMRVKNIDGLGVNQGWITTEYTYYTGTDESGRLKMVESDLNSTEESKIEYVYNSRGERTEVKEHKTSTQWSAVYTDYDDRGLVYRTRQDTLHNDTSSLDTDRLVTEFDYDFAGRTVSRLRPHGSEAFVTEYDNYGRRAKETTPTVDLGKNPTGTQVDGQFKTEWIYDADGLVTRVEKFSNQLPAGGSWSGWNETATTLYEYDEAGRRIRTWVARVAAPQEPPTTYPDDWAEYTVDLYEGGQTERTYIPGQGTSVYHEEELDDINRITTKTSSTDNEIEYEYDGPGGLLSKEIATPYDDSASLHFSCPRSSNGRLAAPGMV